MPTVSIIGCGWVGLPLALRSIAKGWEVRGSARDSEKVPVLRQQGIDGHRLDLADQATFASLQPLLRAAEVAVINIPPVRSRPDVETAHPEEMVPLLRAVADSGAHLIFVGSTSVFSAGQGDVTEQSPLRPARGSGRALAAIEGTLPALTPRHSIVRLAGLIGPGRYPFRALRGGVIEDPESHLNLVHLEDVLAALECVMGRRAEQPATYHVCAPLHPTKRVLYSAVAAALRHPMPTFEASENSSSGKRVLCEALVRDFGFAFSRPDPLEFCLPTSASG
jgi:nucleoside-diphosphate-sugar epimerase